MNLTVRFSCALSCLARWPLPFLKGSCHLSQRCLDACILTIEVTNHLHGTMVNNCCYEGFIKAIITQQLNHALNIFCAPLFILPLRNDFERCRSLSLHGVSCVRLTFSTEAGVSCSFGINAINSRTSACARNS